MGTDYCPASRSPVFSHAVYLTFPTVGYDVMLLSIRHLRQQLMYTVF